MAFRICHSFIGVFNLLFLSLSYIIVKHLILQNTFWSCMIWLVKVPFCNWQCQPLIAKCIFQYCHKYLLISLHKVCQNTHAFGARLMAKSSQILVSTPEPKAGPYQGALRKQMIIFLLTVLENQFSLKASFSHSALCPLSETYFSHG